MRIKYFGKLQQTNSNMIMYFYSLRAGARRVLVRNKFLRHGGACDLFCYIEKHVACKRYTNG